MWKQQIIEIAERVGHSFNNHKVFERIVSNNPEYPEPIIYLPLREYCNTRFLRAIENHGVDNFQILLNEGLPGVRSSVTLTNETRALAFVIGIRETGMPFLGWAPQPVVGQPSPTFRTRTGIFLRNFSASGLDNIHSQSIQGRMGRYMDRGMMARTVVDDPQSQDVRNVGIRQSRIRTIFNIYLRHQADNLLNSVNLASMERETRLFWRALTFGGQGGSPWESSLAGGRISLMSLMDYLGTQPANVKKLWDNDELKRLVGAISNPATLQKIARHPTDASRRHIRESNDIAGWRSLAVDEVEKGMGTIRYFQAIKAAAITEGILGCTTWPPGN